MTKGPRVTVRTLPVNGVVTAETSARTLSGCVNNFKAAGVSFHPAHMMEIITVDYAGFFPVVGTSWAHVSMLATEDKRRRKGLMAALAKVSAA